MSPKIRLLVTAGTAFAATAVSAQSLDQTREYAAEVMADAQQRTSLLGSSAAHHSQFGLTSADGSSTLNFSGWHQTRYTLTFLDDAGGGPIRRQGDAPATPESSPYPVPDGAGCAQAGR